MREFIALLALLVSSVPHGHAQDPNAGTDLANEYLRAQTEQITRDCLADIESLSDWQVQRAKRVLQLRDMLGLNPWPARGQLNAKVTGVLSHDDFEVHQVHFQSLPGLYVTANLYRPKSIDRPLPAILYVCGHGRSETDGRSNGNKARYQHHGAWFARNGYVCLTIDTIQLGEIEGLHHGTYREKMWWWINRGYTPAGVEAWNSIRALDYLETLDEVDADRMGVTGRSGGGAYSWWLAALDDRIKAAVPVAGITSLENHVVDGCVEGHCDCMYPINTYRWDFPMVAALVAPRPLLISNTDKDRIFPLDGVLDVHAKARAIYELYDAKQKLGLHITEGPHKDTQELRIHAFRWLNRWLKNDDNLVETTATPFFAPERLRVFNELPTDESVTSIHESFVAKAPADLPSTDIELAAMSRKTIGKLSESTFRGWPESTEPLSVSAGRTLALPDVRIAREYQFRSQAPYDLTFWIVQKKTTQQKIKSLAVKLLTAAEWDEFSKLINAAESSQNLPDYLATPRNSATVVFAPRGIGPTAWPDDQRYQTHLQRRFVLLGQTIASMRTWDTRRCIQALATLPEFKYARVTLHGESEAATWALYASLFEKTPVALHLSALPNSHRESSPLLNVSRVATLEQILMIAAKRLENGIRITNDEGVRTQLAEHPLMKNRIQIPAN